MKLKHSEACERNKGPILEILKKHLSGSNKVLEIGSGTGQHAVYFAEHLDNLSWQTSELKENISDLTERIKLEGPDNVLKPVELDVTQRPWPLESADAVFTANTLHIMPWKYSADFFQGVGKILSVSGKLCIYGPFKYCGKYTSESNAEFDGWLKKHSNWSGIREFEEVDKLASRQGLKLIHDYSMPANNQLIVWGK